MHVCLKLETNQRSLTETASQERCEVPGGFHGIAELLALLETARETAAGTPSCKARR